MSPIQIARRFLEVSPCIASDSDLLNRFISGADQDAFTKLVEKFGPLVLATCRRILGPSADAEDAFQAVFLTLAQRAASIRDPAALTAWLHRVALRVSHKVLARRRPLAALPDTVSASTDPFADVAWKEVRRILDEELDRLPEKHRGPVILCLVNGAEQDEAANRLGLSLNTLKRRLNAGRDLLRRRLLRRGVAPVLVAAAVLDPTGLRAAVPAALLAATVRLKNSKAAPHAVAALVAGPTGWNALRCLVAVVIFTAISVALGATSGLTEPDTVRAVADPPQAPGLRARVPDEVAGEPLPKGVTARFGSLHYRVPGRIYCTAVSKDGKLIALHTGNGTVRVYEADSWKPVRTFTTDDGEGAWASGRNLAFSPDGRYLGFARSGKSVYVLDLKTGIAGPWFGDNDRLRWNGGCIFTPDGFLGVSDSKRLYFYDPDSGREIRSAPTGAPSCLSPAGDTFVRMAANAPGDVELILCDAKSGAELHRFEGTVRWAKGAKGFAFAPDGKTLAIVAEDRKEVQLWDLKTKKKIAAFSAPDAPFPEEAAEADVGFTHDGRTVYLRLKNGDIARWDAGTKKELPRLQAAGGYALGSLYALPDGKTLLTPVHTTGWVRVWDAATANETPIHGRYRWIASLALSPDGRMVAMGDDTGRIDLLDAQTARLVRTLRAKGDPVGKIVFSPDGRVTAVTESKPHTARLLGSPVRVRVLRIEDGREVQKFEGKPEARNWYPTPLGFTVDGRQVIISGASDKLGVFDVDTGKQARAFGPDNPHAALSPDGRMVATGDRDATVLVDVATGKVIKRISVEEADKIKDWAFDGCRYGWSADGKSLICARPVDLVTIHDADSGREKARFSSYPEGFPAGFDYLIKQGRLLTSTVRFSPDGKRAITVARSGSVITIWDLERVKVIAALDNDLQVEDAVFTPDGKAIITSPYVDGGIGYRWDLDAVIATQKK